jgi:hypothetical protein
VAKPEQVFIYIQHIHPAGCPCLALTIGADLMLQQLGSGWSLEPVSHLGSNPLASQPVCMAHHVKYAWHTRAFTDGKPLYV